MIRSIFFCLFLYHLILEDHKLAHKVFHKVDHKLAHKVDDHGMDMLLIVIFLFSRFYFLLWTGSLRMHPLLSYDSVGCILFVTYVR